MHAAQVFMTDSSAPKLNQEPLAQNIARTLGERIVKGDLDVGARLNEAVFAREFGVSHSPVRESFMLLEQQGLVEMLPRKGARVIEVPEQDFEDTQFILAHLLASAVIDAGNPQKLDQYERSLLEALEDLKTAANDEDSSGYLKALQQFLTIVYDAYGRRLTLSLHNRIYPMFQLTGHAVMNAMGLDKHLAAIMTLTRHLFDPETGIDEPLVRSIFACKPEPQSVTGEWRGISEGALALSGTKSLQISGPSAAQAFTEKVDRLTLVANLTQPTLPQFIADYIRNQLQTGALKQGDRLIEEDYAEKFQCSRGPIREGFRLLASNGMVEIRPRRGTFVRRHSTSEVAELYDIRCRIFKVISQQAAQNLNRAGDKAAWWHETFADGLELFRTLVVDESIPTLSLVEMRRALSKLVSFASQNRVAGRVGTEIEYRLFEMSLTYTSMEARTASLANWEQLFASFQDGNAEKAADVGWKLVKRSKKMAIAEQLASL